MGIDLLIFLTGVITFVVIIVSAAAINEECWKTQIGIPIYAVIFALWFWITLYCNSEPVSTQESKITTIHETIKNDGSNVQWIYNYDGNYQPLDSFYKNPEEYTVILYEENAHSRYGLYPMTTRKIDYQVKKKEQ